MKIDGDPFSTIAAIRTYNFTKKDFNFLRNSWSLQNIIFAFAEVCWTNDFNLQPYFVWTYLFLY